MDQVQNTTAEYSKKLVSKANFLTVYDFAVLRGITSLSNFITSTIVKPAEVVTILFSFPSHQIFSPRLYGGGNMEHLIWT